jgi:hypothetical protein
MKQIITLKNLLIASCIAGASVANGQVHPLAFGARTLISGGAAESNWYKDYVGLRFVVNSPSAVAGEKPFSHPGTGTTPWGTTVTTPINNVQIVMPPLGGDTIAASAFPAGSMAGKIGYVYRGGGIEFVCKAVNCVNAGAIAVVIVNNVNGGPIPMGAGSVCAIAGVTVPVFMISKEDGDPITGLYRAGDTARFTITPWGLGIADDLGFVPGGLANWHNFAVPSNQLGATGNPFEYKMGDGAFIANYGTTDVTGVNVTSSTSFTPTGGSPTPQHTNTVTLASFPALDSIYAMFPPTEYDLAASGTGRFDVTYNITHSVTDGYPEDNTLTSSFYVTDSLYSKGRYDFVNNIPVRTVGYSYSSTDNFIWGPMYFVKTGGTAISRVQYSISVNTTTPGTPLGGPFTLYLFKWSDGSNGQPTDSVMQDGELELVSLGTHNMGAPGDTSGAILNFSGMGDPLTGNPKTIELKASSWYYLAVEVPTGHFLGADGVMHPLPRIYGRALNAGILDYSNIVGTSPDAFLATPDQGNIPVPNTFSNYIGTVDSFNYANTKGIIPAVAMIANNNPVFDAVNDVPAKVDTKVALFPNPAKDNMQVSLTLDQESKSVSYTIVDGLGRFVSKETHKNVKEETFNLNTSKLPVGHYFFVVNTDSKTISRNFVIIK